MEVEGLVYVQGDRAARTQQDAEQQDMRQRDSALLQSLDSLLLLAVTVAQEGQGVALRFELAFDTAQTVL